MPIYKYKCEECDYEFEKLSSMDIDCGDIVLRENHFCPECGYMTKRIFGKPNLHFKGKNFTKNVEKRGD